MFPLLFFLVAVPWPAGLERPVIKTLTLANSAVTVEFVNLVGIPAIQHGNVIEVSTGSVGIDEACSGIRSFQATLMISLFFGELFRLSVLRRLALCFAGFALSFVFNVARTTLLTVVAAKQGINAIAGWHDPAGVTILVACFATLWGLSLWLREGPRDQGTKGLREQGAKGPRDQGTGDYCATGLRTAECQTTGPRTEAPKHRATEPPPSAFRPRPSAFWLILPAWLLISELGVEAWYRTNERGLPDPVTWTVSWPERNPTFQNVTMSDKSVQLLRYDEGRHGRWTNPDGTQWQMIYLRWDPGVVAHFVPNSHTPDNCLTAAGHHVQASPQLMSINVNGLSMPFRHYRLDSADAPRHVYYCLWEDRADHREFVPISISYATRFHSVLTRHRLTGKRSVEVLISGIPDPVEAEAALKRQLEHIIKVERKGE